LVGLGFLSKEQRAYHIQHTHTHSSNARTVRGDREKGKRKGKINMRRAGHCAPAVLNYESTIKSTRKTNLIMEIFRYNLSKDKSCNSNY